VAVDPESIGLCGCWQVIAVQRERVPLGVQPDPASVEIGYYATSLGQREHSDQELLKIIRDHWAAIENGSHYRRDNTFDQDSCQTSKPGAAQILAALRNLAIGFYELEKDRGHTQVNEFKSWCRQMTASTALKLVLRT
jgi:hypothetical protein